MKNKSAFIHCAIRNGRQANNNKISNHFVLSKIGEKRYWRILVNEASQFQISDFFESKNAVIEPTYEKLFNLNEASKLDR
jgi:hypothetical protein